STMPEYTAAVKVLEDMTQTARKKTDAMLAEAKQMFQEFQQYQNEMSNVQRERYKKMIIEKEKAANDYEKSMFGEEGEIAKRQKELMEPIERKVLAVVESFAKRGGYDMIFDLSLVKVTIYQSEKLDMTQIKN
ncbi:MAG: OmpH family outer membrane protein, partial [Rikenellaceae bacterium]